MFFLWLKRTVLVIFVLSGITFYGCISLSFAGGWVGPFADTVETLAIGSAISGFFSGLLLAYLYRDKILKNGKK